MSQFKTKPPNNAKDMIASFAEFQAPNSHTGVSIVLFGFVLFS